MAPKQRCPVLTANDIGPRIIMAAIVLICTSGAAWLAVMAAAD